MVAPLAWEPALLYYRTGIRSCLHRVE